MEYTKKKSPSSEMLETEFVADVKSTIQALDYDITVRNTYINTRDRAIYGDGLFEGLEFPDGHDKTLYNWPARVVDIHAGQVMGRGFTVFSTYDKEDPDATEDQEQQKLINLRNKRRKADADARKRAIDAIIKDNGGKAIFHLGAKIGSGFGQTVIKEWFDKKENKSTIKILENVQNYRPGWNGDDFRARDWDAFVYQISFDSATRSFGNLEFEWTKQGQPLSGINDTSDPLNQKDASGTDMPTQSDRAMVTVIDITGYIPGWAADGKNDYKKVKRGEETKLSCLIVGGKVVQVITEESLMPDFYIIPNKIEPRRANGASDLNDSALSIARTFIEVMSTAISLYHKEIAPTYKAKGFLAGGIPPRRKKEATMIPMTQEQDIDLIPGRNGVSAETDSIINALKEEFVRVTSVGRVMFDDPTINANSNQALMTTLKGLIDVTEEKQARWEAELVKMFKRALQKAAKHISELKEVVDTEESWDLYIEWPSVLRKEDATYQQMWNNIWNSSVISPESYLQKLGFEDPGEELDRIRDSLKDPVLAAMMGRAVPVLAQQLISPPQPQGPQVKYNVNVAADAAPDANPEENSAIISEVMGAAQYPQMATPQAPATPDQPGPQLTTDQNTGQVASQPGSGAPAVSPEGAIAQANQNAGV